MKIENLILEVTRKCNMSCAHCMRGQTTHQTMPPILFERIFDQISEVDTLVITGGEPSLVLDNLRALKDIIINKHIIIHSLFITTNGKADTKELLEVFNDLVDISTGEYASSFEISNDKYHHYDGKAYDVSYLDDLKAGLALNPKLKVHFHTTMNDYQDVSLLIPQGRARKLNPSANHRINKLTAYPLVNPDVVIGDFYIAADSYIVGDCDLSYETILFNSIGDAFDIQDAIKNITRQSLEDYRKFMSINKLANDVDTAQQFLCEYLHPRHEIEYRDEVIDEFVKYA